jgi:hypothetical protein
MVEIIICDADGVEQREFGRRFHDNAPQRMLFDGAPCEFMRFKAPGVAVYRRLPMQGASTEMAPITRDRRSSGKVRSAVVEILSATDSLRVGTLDLRNGELATSSVDLTVAWERLRREGVRRAVGAPPMSFWTAPLAEALSALRQQGFHWRLAGAHKGEKPRRPSERRRQRQPATATANPPSLMSKPSSSRHRGVTSPV